MGKECFECGKSATEEHHVIPRVLGGTKTIPLCGCCHALVHGGYNKRRDDHKQLTIEGLRRAKENGKVLGNRTNLRSAQELGNASLVAEANEFALKMYEIIGPLFEGGMTMKAIAIYLNDNGVKTHRSGKWHNTSVHNIIKRVRKLQASSSDSTQIEQSTSRPEQS
jgi:hypothetical protein